MPRFSYRAKKGPHEIVKGILEAENQDTAVNRIIELGYFPLEIIAEKPEAIKKTSGFSFNLFSRPRAKDLGIFTRQLSDLLNAGLTLIKALDIVQRQTQNHILKKIIIEVGNSVKDGSTLSDALAKYPQIFSQLYVNMVRAGEISGSLDVVLGRLADFSDKEEDTRAKIQASLVYPMLMALLGVLTVFVLLTFVIPRLVSMFVELSQALPLPTQILINVSGFLFNFRWLIIILISILVIYFRRRSLKPERKFVIDMLKLRIPFLGDFIKKIEIARFGRTLATLLASGVTIIQSLEAVSQVLENEVLRRDTQRMLKDVVDGSSLTHTMLKSKYFPEVVVNMVAVGEEAGRLEDALFKLADSFERQSDRIVKTITSLIEPMMILVIGSVVGFIVIAMLLPIFQMNLIIR